VSDAAIAELTPKIGVRNVASYNERAWWDNHRAYELGYRPTGRGEDFREHALAEQAKLKPDPVGDFYQGGTFCSMEFDGDRNRVIDWKK